MTKTSHSRTKRPSILIVEDDTVVPSNLQEKLESLGLDAPIEIVVHRGELELAHRFASLGTMTAGVAHEVNNPLTVVVSNASIVSTDLEAFRAELARLGTPLTASLRSRLDDMTQTLADITAAGTRIGRTVADLRSFVRPPSRETGRTDVVQALQWALRATAHELRLRATVKSSFEPVPLVAGDDVRLGQVFVNLLVNAAQAIQPGNAERNVVSLSTRLAEDGRVMVTISDTGEGIPEAARERVFDDFFSTKAAGVGTGLGLSICHGIIESIGGTLTLESEIGRGSTFSIVLQAAAPISEVLPPIDVTARELARQARVLAVDDEPMVLRSIQRSLREHEVLCFERAADALFAIELEAPFDVVFCDLMMPSMTGVELYESLQKRNPELARKIIFMTGGATSARTEEFLQGTSNQCIQKPFTAATLQLIVNQRRLHP